MESEFKQVDWDAALEDDCRHLFRLAVREDLDRSFDLTTLALVPPDARGGAWLVAREEGILCGLRAGHFLLRDMNVDIHWQPLVEEGARIRAATRLARLEGNSRDLLTTERTLLNLVGRLSGIATLASRYVEAVAGTGARIYDTRKTTPGWRRLEKYAVRCGGARNHRSGLYDAVLIKDNHLAQAAGSTCPQGLSPADAVRLAREFLNGSGRIPGQAERVLVEVEVDTLEQLDEVLPLQPDIVLLDNFSTGQLRDAVGRRDRVAPLVQLEASGGVRLETVRSIAESGVERISVGALTHAATSLDVALDWDLPER